MSSSDGVVVASWVAALSFPSVLVARVVIRASTGGSLSGWKSHALGFSAVSLALHFAARF
jgi:hypothetical protein